jgi:hypothetical protein
MQLRKVTLYFKFVYNLNYNYLEIQTHKKAKSQFSVYRTYSKMQNRGNYGIKF